MADENGADAGAVADPASREMIAQLLEKPHGWNFFAAVRLLQGQRGGRPGVGAAGDAKDDVVKFHQRPIVAFRPAQIAEVGRAAGAAGPRYEVTQAFFGLFGPRGPLPQHITEYAAESLARTRQASGLVAFCNLLQHRMTSLLYRAWAASNLAASRDLGGADPFLRIVDATFGAAQPAFGGRTALDDDLRRHLAGAFSSGNGSSAALAAVVGAVIDAPVSVDGGRGEWLSMPPTVRSCLGRGVGAPARLGRDAFLGAHVFSMQTHVVIETAPLPLRSYRALLPGGALSDPVRAAIRQVLGLATAALLRPVLRRGEVPECRLGGGVRLGWDAWMATPARAADADDLTLRIGG